jgi:Fic family protein
MHGLHQRLLDGVRGQRSVGRFKEYQNFIGSRPDDPISEAVFVPPPPERVIELVSDLERYINQQVHEPKVVQCALAHYQFETIHPFSDGNGRVGRLLIILQLIQQKLLSAPLIYPSVYFERTRQEYYHRLQDVRERSAWNEWVTYFAKGIAQQCRETIALTQTILALRQQLRDQVVHVRRRAACGEVLDAFFESPTLSIRQISDRAHLTPNSVQATLVVLEELGLVYEFTGRQKGRIYACRPILNAIFADRSPLWEKNSGLTPSPG